MTEWIRTVCASKKARADSGGDGRLDLHPIERQQALTVIRDDTEVQGIACAQSGLMQVSQARCLAKIVPAHRQNGKGFSHQARENSERICP